MFFPTKCVDLNYALIIIIIIICLLAKHIYKCYSSYIDKTNRKQHDINCMHDRKT